MSYWTAKELFCSRFYSLLSGQYNFGNRENYKQPFLRGICFLKSFFISRHESSGQGWDYNLCFWKWSDSFNMTLYDRCVLVLLCRSDLDTIGLIKKINICVKKVDVARMTRCTYRSQCIENKNGVSGNGRKSIRHHDDTSIFLPKMLTFFDSHICLLVNPTLLSEIPTLSRRIQNGQVMNTRNHSQRCWLLWSEKLSFVKKWMSTLTVLLLYWYLFSLLHIYSSFFSSAD